MTAPEVANSMSNSGTVTGSTVLKRGALETWSQVKPRTCISKCESGSCFLNPPKSDWADREESYFLKISLGGPLPNKRAPIEGIWKELSAGKGVKHANAPGGHISSSRDDLVTGSRELSP